MSLLNDVQLMNKYNRGEADIRFKKLIVQDTDIKLYKCVEKEMIQVI